MSEGILTKFGTNMDDVQRRTIITQFVFSCLCHEMTEEHIVFTLSVCLCFVCLLLCSHNLVPPITLSCVVGFQSYKAQIIFMTRQCVAYKNHVASLKVKVTLHV